MPIRSDDLPVPRPLASNDLRRHALGSHCDLSLRRGHTAHAVPGLPQHETAAFEVCVVR